MTDETAPEVTPAPPAPVDPPPPVRYKTRLSDILFGWKSAVALFAGGLILGGLGGMAIGWAGGHDHRGRHDRIMQMRMGGPEGYGYHYDGGPYGGGPYGGFGTQGGTSIPPNMVPPGSTIPQTPTAPSAVPTPKKS